ncbi:3-hydroxyacyl-CoA dehydrogenase NAD-binding domain-containing protein, partial [Halostella sp. PRR32]
MRICVLGAGTMGHGIAQVSAMAGHDVAMRDIDETVLDE